MMRTWICSLSALLLGSARIRSSVLSTRVFARHFITMCLLSRSQLRHALNADASRKWHRRPRAIAVRNACVEKKSAHLSLPQVYPSAYGGVLGSLWLHVFQKCYSGRTLALRCCTHEDHRLRAEAIVPRFLRVKNSMVWTAAAHILSPLVARKQSRVSVIAACAAEPYRYKMENEKKMWTDRCNGSDQGHNQYTSAWFVA